MHDINQSEMVLRRPIVFRGYRNLKKDSNIFFIKNIWRTKKDIGEGRDEKHIILLFGYMKTEDCGAYKAPFGTSRY